MTIDFIMFFIGFFIGLALGAMGVGVVAILSAIRGGAAGGKSSKTEIEALWTKIDKERADDARR
jgi:hypothetical protein